MLRRVVEWIKCCLGYHRIYEIEYRGPSDHVTIVGGLACKRRLSVKVH